MDAGATSWLMVGSLIKIPLLAVATNVRAIVTVSILLRQRRVLGGHQPICATEPVETTE
jgi:hypothetical protein